MRPKLNGRDLATSLWAVAVLVADTPHRCLARELLEGFKGGFWFWVAGQLFMWYAREGKCHMFIPVSVKRIVPSRVICLVILYVCMAWFGNPG